MVTENLLGEFPPVSTQSWEDVIRKDLKGADYAKKLIWQTDEGLAVKPYYRSEDVADLQYPLASPGEFPYARSARASGDWRIREEIDLADPEAANRAALAAVVAGAEEIAFSNTAIRNSSDLGLLLANLQEIPLHFEDAGESLLNLLVERLNLRPQSVSAGWNPLADVEFAAKVAGSAPAGFVPFTIHAEEFEESGATAVEEVGFALAAGIDYLAEMQSRKIAIDRAAEWVAFSFAIGASFFFQIAKLRAFRMLWARAVESFGGSAESAKARIYARTSHWNETVYDPHVNVLRGTTEAMSAVMGGANSVTVAPFDECYKRPDEDSRRLARNTQILLRQESHLEKVADPGAGSYSLEAITDFIAKDGWKRMQEIEAAGGYGKALAGGMISKSLEKSMAAKDKAVQSRRRVFTGTNQFANLKEKALDRIDSRIISSKRRATGAYEELRLRTERHAAKTGKLPRVVLAEIGDVKMRGARSGFAANFFGCAGFEVVTQRFDNCEGIAAADADLIVLCSSDAEYLALATEVLEKLKAKGRQTSLIVAGAPETADQLRAAGVADFVNVRSNPIHLLSEWQRLLGVEE
jgi:methylmalonyl-CoA mutase